MKIVIITVGTRGDVQPFVALGVALKQAGHTVTICTSSRFQLFISEYGLNYAYMNDQLLKLIDTDAGRAAIESKGNAFFLWQQTMPIIRQTLDEAWIAAQEAEILIYHPKALGGYHIAEKLNIPGFMSLLLPLYTPTTAFPSPIFPNLKGGWYNQLTYQLLPLLTAPYLNVINQWRQERLGLRPRSWNEKEILGSYGDSSPVLYAYSSHLIPRPSDWDSSTIVTGYWFLDAPADFVPPPQLLDFLANGKPPLCIGFGSMTGQNPTALREIVLTALKNTGQRGILLTGWGDIGNADLPNDVFKLEAIPHDWLFPQVAAVMHHGGAGTTAAALRAGIPNIIIPFFGDQPFWGQRVEALGVGPKPIPKKHLTAEKLAAAINVAVNDEEVRRRALSLGAKIRAEDGVAQAVKVINRFSSLS
ncbi:glycosyltransferase [Calothrix sp. PCC 7507]|uniref:glycosyltransferase n=1 Tax=Calothrix sp. PCC 7507 TaxID=99598 RepID=UPI00029EDA7F|nr:glycosyltransferase [Calothrix sp. PCC 7507]AFY35770.1 Sterol 3-beta-glucosyltransferase [Calothrix sp. PCC 7507]